MQRHQEETARHLRAPRAGGNARDEAPWELVGAQGPAAPGGDDDTTIPPARDHHGAKGVRRRKLDDLHVGRVLRDANRPVPSRVPVLAQTVGATCGTREFAYRWAGEPATEPHSQPVSHRTAD